MSYCVEHCRIALGTCQLSLVVFVGWFRLDFRAAFLEWAIAFLWESGLYCSDWNVCAKWCSTLMKCMETTENSVNFVEATREGQAILCIVVVVSWSSIVRWFMTRPGFFLTERFCLRRFLGMAFPCSSMEIWRMSRKGKTSVLELEFTIGSNDDRETALDVVQEELSVNWDGFVGKSCFLASLFELEFELLDPILLGNLG